MVHRFIALSLALAFAATAQAADKPASAETAAPKVDAAKGQQVAAQICAACHNPMATVLLPRIPSSPASMPTTFTSS